jgi:hypothetical protein
MAFVENASTRVSSIWERISPMLERAGDALKKALSDPGTFDRIESVLKLYAAVKIGGAVMPGLAGAAGSALEAGAASGMGIAALAGSAAIAGAAVAVLGAAVYGAVDNLTDSTKQYHTLATEQMGSISTEFDKLKASVTDNNGVVMKVTDALGVGLLVAVNESIKSLNYWSGEVMKSYEFMAAPWKALANQVVPGDLGDDPADARGRYTFQDDQTQKNGEFAATFNLFNKSLNEIGGRADDERAKTKPVNGGGGTTIQKVEIVVSSNQDPSRIARAVEDRLANVSRNPTSSRMVRNWSAVR